MASIRVCAHGSVCAPCTTRHQNFLAALTGTLEDGHVRARSPREQCGCEARRPPSDDHHAAHVRAVAVLRALRVLVVLAFELRLLNA